MTEQTNLKLTSQAWAEIVIKEFVNKARALGIAKEHPLTDLRFIHHVNTNANGDPERIQFAYDYYLNFVDWGVGKGVTLENRNMLFNTQTTRRRKKPWFSDVFFGQVKRLTHILAKKHANIAAKKIVFEFSGRKEV